MWMESDSLYFSRRAQQERDAATRASHSNAREAHLVMARRFENLSQAIAANERRWKAR